MECPERLLLRAHRHLVADAAPLLAAWRRLPTRRGLSPRAQATLEQLLLPQPAGRGLAPWREQVRYTAARLAKLGVSMRQVSAAATRFRLLAEARLGSHVGARHAAAAQAWFQRETERAVAEAYVALQGSAVQTLLKVLDAELRSATLDELLQRLLGHAAKAFPIRWGEILLVQEEESPGAGRSPGSAPLQGPVLRHAAAYGLEPGMILEAAGVGPFFQGVMRRATPAFLLDAANDPRVAQPYYRALDVKSVWAVPLVRRAPAAPGRGRARARPEVLGILTVGFDRVYECLPQERNLLLALAERSTLAIERTRMAERLRCERARVVDLSRRLLEAQEDERRRISRDLHDETGQALLTLRLYLEMGLRQGSPEAARAWFDKAVALVDRSVADLRRILAQLSPLLLDELGLEPALRLELRRLRAQHGWRARFTFTPRGARLDPALEVLIYRLVLEGLRNVARHARARRVHLSITVRRAEVAIRLRDDGVGLPGNQLPPPCSDGSRFGLFGMRERVRLAGGQLALVSAPGRGLSLSIRMPIPRAAAPAPEAAAAHAG
jgi:signal transduction histidine kinase